MVIIELKRYTFLNYQLVKKTLSDEKVGESYLHTVKRIPPRIGGIQRKKVVYYCQAIGW